VPAKRLALTFSPVGSLETIAFTTQDGFFDVTVSVFQASTDKEIPLITATEAAGRISSAYAATFE
jgi:hypothetical protein